MASERESGYYWVRPVESESWIISWFSSAGHWLEVSEVEDHYDNNYAQIGPRCYPPPEQTKRSVEGFVAELKRVMPDAK